MYFNDYAFRPIEKPLEDWQGSDLWILKEISEGEFIDYKGSSIENKKIAKHLAAFANQHGGWLFFGVKEGENERKAESFPGIDKEEVVDLLKRISEVSAQRIQPFLRFEDKVFNGPIPEIGLEEHKAIVAIGIPRGLTPPYIVNGVIYRRLHDKSEPVKETDYSTIKDLWNLRESSRKKLEDFTSHYPTPELAFKESLPLSRTRSSWLHLFLISDFIFKNYLDLRFEDFVETMENENGFKFDNFFSAKDGFICRQKTTNNPKRLLPSFRWWKNGNARISIPINVYPVETVDDTKLKRLNNYQFLKEFIGIAKDTGFIEIEIADFSYLWIALISIINKYLILNKRAGNRGKPYARIILTEMAGVSPFIDEEECLNNSKAFGIPVIEDNKILIPETVDFESLINFQPFLNSLKESGQLHSELLEEAKESDYRCVPISLVILFRIATSVGLVNDLEGFFKFKSIIRKSN